MSDDLENQELDEPERRLYSQLPRESAIDPDEEDRLIGALEAEGFLRRRTGPHWMRQVAAAIALLAIGAWGGAELSARRSLEGMLARDDLSLADRVLLLQRTGSAYVQSAHDYAAATANIDTTAVEVARQVLLGAAHAVARSNLDGGVSARLTAVLQAPPPQPVSQKARPVIWF